MAAEKNLTGNTAAPRPLHNIVRHKDNFVGELVTHDGYWFGKAYGAAWRGGVTTVHATEEEAIAAVCALSDGEEPRNVLLVAIEADGVTRFIEPPDLDVPVYEYVIRCDPRPDTGGQPQRLPVAYFEPL